MLRNKNAGNFKMIHENSKFKFNFSRNRRHEIDKIKHCSWIALVSFLLSAFN